MKNLLLIVSIGSLLFACSAPDKKAELDKLKKEAVGLKEKIANLEAEIALTDTSADANEKVKIVGVQALQNDTFRNFIEVQGKVDADENVSLSPEMPGAIMRINVKPGDEVTTGQVLVELDNKVILNGMAELKNALDLSTTVYEKQKNLWSQKIGTEIQYLSAKSQKESLEKKMATLQEQLDMTRIKSPISGVVDAVDAKLGQMAAPGFPIVRVVNFNNLKVKAEVPETYANKVKKGNPVLIVFPDTQDSVKTTVSFSAKVINAVNRTFEVQVLLDNKKEYHPNMVSVIHIVDYTNPSTIIIPIKVVQHANDGDFVFIADGAKAKKVKVQIGKTYNGKAEVLSGLKPADNLIVSGYPDLNDGEKLRIEKEI